MKTRPNLLTSTRSGFLAVTIAVAGVSPSAFAAQQTWDGAASGVWDTSALNWAGSPFTSGNDALFTGTPTNNVTTATGLTIGAITLDGSFTGTVAMTGANTVSGVTTISGGTLNLTNVGGLGTSAVTVNSGGALSLNAGNNATYSNVTSGAGAISVTPGANDAFITGNLSGFTGTLTLNASGGTNSGKTRFTTTQGNLISSSATINVSANTTLYLNQALSYGAGIHLFGAGNNENLGALRLETGANQTGSVTLRANSFIGVNGSAATISGAIGQNGGSFGFTKQGNNTLTLTGTNTYTGTTTISAGTLQIGNGTTDGSIANAGNVTNNATLNFNNINPLTYTGNITGAGGILTKTGAGALTFGGTSSVTTLNVNNATGTVDLGSGGSLTINNGGGNTIQSSTGGTISGGTITLGASDGDTGTASGTTLTINSKITSGAGVRLEYWNGAVGNTGTLVLTNPSNDYTGGTVINTAGTISVSTINNTGSAGNLGTGGTVSLATNSATLKYTGAGETTNRTITMSGGANTGGTIDASGTGALRLSNVTNTNTADGTATLRLTGTGIGEITSSLANQSATRLTAVTKAGIGTWRLSGSNDLGSNMNVTAGSLEITGTTSINGGSGSNLGYFNAAGNASVTVLSGGSLSILGTTNATKPNSIVGQNAAGTSTLTVNGGVLTIGANTGFALGNNLTTATGVLTISSGTATITAGSATLQNSLNFVALGRDAATGIINLDGGTLATGRQFLRDGNSNGTAGSGTANFNFNGGTLQAQADQTSGNGWFETATSGNFQVVTTTVKVGGAKIDTGTFTTNINTVLAHDSALGATADGGLTMSGSGTLSLGGVNTYTGATSVLGGKLVVNGSTAGASTVTVSAGTLSATPVATLGGTGTIGGSVALSGESSAGFKNGGVLAPAASASGTAFKVTGTTSFNTGSIFEWDLNATSSDTGNGAANSGIYGQLAGSGAISGSNSVFQIVLGSNSFSDAFWDTNKSWTNIFTGGGATTNLASIFSGGFGGNGVDTAGFVSERGTFSFSGTSTLTWTAVPEPTSALVGLLVVGGMLRRRRR
jgi:autotransporter-associated beta strand protein